MSARRPLRSPRALATAAAVTILAALALTGCAGTVSLEPAADATNAACADVIVHLPDTAGDAVSRETNAQSTAAWGDPASVLLHCGVEVPGPSTLPCLDVNGIDWIRDDSRSDDNIFTLTTFGRDPAVQFTVDQNVTSASSVMVDLAAAVGRIPATGQCTNIDDGNTLDTTTTPSP